MVTRDDVAKHAGVSVAVVSYVVNNKSNVKEATRQKVLQAIAELGYNPNLTARSLKTKKTGQFGVLFHNLGNPFETGVSLGLEERARQLGRSLIFQTYIRSEEEKLKTVFMGRADGLLLMGQSLQPETLTHFAKMGVPVYSVTTPAHAAPTVKAIDIDWLDAMLRLVGHLHDLGHVRIGFMGHSMPDHHHRIRYEQFLQALHKLGLGFDPASMLLEGDGKLEVAYIAMSKQLRECAGQLPFTAIVCANDLMGIGVLSACKDGGLAVPRQLSVAACEDILMASHTTPTLTTLHFPRREAGFTAIDLLVQHIDAEHELPDCTVDFKLTIRESTARVPKTE
ncbi:LacI family DNA-binding transcriptional regulator [Paenibacillus sp. GCM10027626]|uniref:LacI family DNA-binding transcriptional regulator n=1 Tax=Paenibacillus sp. GCM10027626 TaxID=3273411 RepID=UPI00364101AD